MAAQASFVNVRCAVQTFAAEKNSAAVISVTFVAAVSCRAKDAVEHSVTPRIRAAARRENERRICMDEGYARIRGHPCGPVGGCADPFEVGDAGEPVIRILDVEHEIAGEEDDQVA